VINVSYHFIIRKILSGHFLNRNNINKLIMPVPPTQMQYMPKGYQYSAQEVILKLTLQLCILKLDLSIQHTYNLKIFLNEMGVETCL
jgi:hypothetical protein